MSLIDELRERGVTREDLERAAAVRLFEKAAAAENVDLNQISEEQVELLFQEFVTPTSTKEASTMADQNVDAVINLFTKTASDEGVDLDQFTEEQVDELFAYFVEEVLPGMLEEGGAEKAASDKLAEAEILGRHMARAYMDELEKSAAVPARVSEAIARAKSAVSRGGRRAGELLSAKHVRGNVREVAGGGAGKMDMVRAYGNILRGKAGNSAMTSEARKSLGAQAGALGAAGAGAYGAKKLYDRKKSMDKKASSEEVMAEATARANQFIGAGSIEAHDGSFVDDLALDLLKDNGYSW